MFFLILIKLINASFNMKKYIFTYCEQLAGYKFMGHRTFMLPLSETYLTEELNIIKDIGHNQKLFHLT